MRVYSRSAGKIIDRPDATPQATSTSSGYDIPYDRFKQAALLDLLTSGGKSLSKIQTVSEFFKPKEKELEAGEKPRVGADAKVVASARSGIKSAESAKRELFGGSKLGGLAKIYGATTGELPLGLGDITPWGRGLEKDLFNLADAILRIRTGAAAPEVEIRRYLNEFGPRPTDSMKVKRKKIEEMQTELEDILFEMGEKISTKKKKDDPLGIF